MEEAPVPPPLPTTKRQRKPSVRLGDLGYAPSRRPAAESKRSKRSASPSAAGSGASQNNHGGPARRPKTLTPSPPLPADLDINNQIEDPNALAILRVSDSEEEQSRTNNQPDQELKSQPSDQNRVESQNQHTNHNQNQNQNGGPGLNQQGRVHGWLDRLGLERYKPVFDIHEVDLTVLPLLTLEDLKDMGINAVGSRRKLYCAIQELSK